MVVDNFEEKTRSTTVAESNAVFIPACVCPSLLAYTTRAESNAITVPRRAASASTDREKNGPSCETEIRKEQ